MVQSPLFSLIDKKKPRPEVGQGFYIIFYNGYLETNV